MSEETEGGSPKSVTVNCLAAESVVLEAHEASEAAAPHEAPQPSHVETQAGATAQYAHVPLSGSNKSS